METENPVENPTPNVQPPVSQFGVPQAIFAGLVVIAVSIYISFGVPNNKAAVQGSITPADNSSATPQQPAVPVAVSVDDDPVLGDANAPVTLIEFSDFQCPFCRKFWRDTLPDIKKNYIDTGKAKLIYRDFPLPSIHPMAEASAEAGECAQEQGRFWDMHDKIFAEQDEIGDNTVSYTSDDLKKWAGEIGLATQAFDTCLDSGRYKDEVQKDLADGIAAGVQGTPSTFVNGQILPGAQPFATFQQAIDEALK